MGTDSGRNISEIFDAMDQDNDEQISVDEVVDYYKNLPNTRDSVAHFANAMANKDFSTEGKFELHFFGCWWNYGKNLQMCQSLNVESWILPTIFFLLTAQNQEN